MFAHGWLWWVIVGAVAGILAKMLMPGSRKEPSGCIMTILLGIAGGVLTGLAMRTFLHTPGSGGLLGSIVGATIGAIVIIFVFRKVWA
ncbi:MAG: GlsB/YeaQ/YmgE family stress response membrane protein [Armatimonadetes bacterium]|nr:GlsB/YeaQ/YmgE family stress response membrane protein [Armatimonadota bacterium]